MWQKKNKMIRFMKLQHVFTLLILAGIPAIAWYMQPTDKYHDAYASDPNAEHVSAGPLDTRKIFDELMAIQLEEGIETYTGVGSNFGVKSHKAYADKFRAMMIEEENRILAREAEVAAKYSLSREQIEAIIAEGAMKGWLADTGSVVIDAH